ADARVADAARVALMHLPGNRATELLLQALNYADAPRKPAFLNAVAFRGDAAAVAVVTPLLDASRPAVALAAAQALGKLGGGEASSVLEAARAYASPQLALAVETAMLDAGPSPAQLRALAKAGFNTGIRSGAFAQLVSVDPSAASEVLSEVFGSESEGRSAVLRAAMVHGDASLRQKLVGRLDQLDSAEQIVLLGAISDRKLEVYEPQVRGLLESGDGLLVAAAAETLGALGQSASFPALYEAYRQNPGNEAIADAIAAIPGEQIDARLREVAQAGGTEAVAAISVLAERGAEGTVPFLNGLVRKASSEAVKEAALDALREIGDRSSVALLTTLIVEDWANARPYQLALKQLAQNLNTPETLWEEIYGPALREAPSDAARAQLLAILDAFACQGSVDYLAGLIADRDSRLRSRALQSLSRWPQFGAAEVWLEVATDPQATRDDIAAAQRGLVRMFGNRDIYADPNRKVELGVEAVRKGPSVDFKRAILNSFDDLRWNERQSVRRHFPALLEDPEIAAEVQEAIDRAS
ncbi:MAG: HEAT repeat domain-containing protein, partial [Opitutales bacterium]